MATARTRRSPVPPVEPTDDVAPLVEDAAPAPVPAPAPAPLVVKVDGAAVAAVVAAVTAEAAVEPEPAPLQTRFVVARHKGLETYAVLARTSLEGWDGWSYVEDLPEGEPPLLPARFAPAAD